MCKQVSSETFPFELWTQPAGEALRALNHWQCACELHRAIWTGTELISSASEKPIPSLQHSSKRRSRQDRMRFIADSKGVPSRIFVCGRWIPIYRRIPGWFRHLRLGSVEAMCLRGSAGDAGHWKKIVGHTFKATVFNIKQTYIIYLLWLFLWLLL